MLFTVEHCVIWAFFASATRAHNQQAEQTKTQQLTVNSAYATVFLALFPAILCAL